MGYQVVSRFLHRASGRYIDPGQECPPLSVEDGARLVQARCLVVVKDAAPTDPPAPRKARAPRQEASPPPRE